VLKESIRYLLKEQEKVGQEIMGSIYIEEWVHKLIKKDLQQILSDYPRLNSGKFIQIWPFITNVYELAPDVNSLLQPNIDIVYTLGGDGTLLSLIRDLYVNYKPNSLPYIAAFNSGSLGYLCNFRLDEIKAVYDSTIFS
jgi:NAD kinase